MNKNFDYEGAKQAGYSDSEIAAFLMQETPKTSKPSYESTSSNDSAFTKIAKNFRNFLGNLSNPIEKEIPKELSEIDKINQKLLKKVDFDVNAALESGYSADEINDYLKEQQPKKSNLEKGARIAGQYALGAVENALLPYEIGVAALASKEAQNIPYREDIGNEIEDLLIKKSTGQWNQQDEELLNHLEQQIQDPRKSMEFAQAADLGVRDLAENITGQDLYPEGLAEKAAHWTGFIKNPKNAKELLKMGTNPKSIRNAIMPGGKDVLRGLTAGTALQMAENNNFGPMGTMAAAIVGDLAGAGTAGLAKAIINPKETLAKGAALLSNTKGAIKSDLKEAAQEIGFTKDIGTLTNNNMVQMLQARLSSSGLTGKPLENLRKQMTKEIVQEYESIAKELGEARFQSFHEAGEVAKEGLQKIRDADLAVAREFFEAANETIRGSGKVVGKNVGPTVKKFIKSLTPGSIKSSEQKAVLEILKDLEKSVFDEAGNLIPTEVKGLMNNKIALNDIINYEVQGGTKQLLKQVVKELDRDILSHGKESPAFARNYINAKKKFSEHAKIFRQKGIDKILNAQNPEQIMNKMGSVQGVRDLKGMLNKSSEGKKIFQNLARKKMDTMIGDNMKNNVTDQIQLSKMHSLLENPKNKAILREILSPEAFKRLERLQAHVGELAETAQKFFNASQTATAGADMAIVGGLLSGVTSLLTGNPWALHASIGFGAAKAVGKLIADPEFLKLTEESIRAANKNDINIMKIFASNMTNHIRESINPNLLKPKMLQEEEMGIQ